MRSLSHILFSIIITFICCTAGISQNKMTFDLGGGLTYGTDFEEIGLQAHGVLKLNNYIRVGTDFVYWLFDDTNMTSFNVPATVSTTAYEVNGSVHFLFLNENDFTIYALSSIGLHSIRINVDTSEFGSDSGSDSEFSFGLGIGAEYRVGPVKIYTEPRLFFSGFDQLVLSAGLKIPLNY